MALKYSKAPVSEVIFGVFFKTNTLLRGAIFFEILLKIKEAYPLLQNTQEVPTEEIENDNLSFTQGIAFSSYRLSSKDFIYSVDLNPNSFQVTWRRRDDMPSISTYPGYENLSARFNEVFKIIKEIGIAKGILLDKEVRLYNLKYTDRVNLNLYKENGVRLQDIIKVKYPPILFDDTAFYSENYLGKYTINLPSYNSYAIVNINTPTMPNGQHLYLDCSIKGQSDNSTIWFEQAHKSQLSFFENIFTDSILKDWN